MNNKYTWTTKFQSAVKFLTVAVGSLAILLTNEAKAVQPNTYQLGIWAGAKAASNIQVLPRGRQAQPAFNFLPDIGIRAYLPVSSGANIHVVPEFSFNNYHYTTKDVPAGVNYRTEISSLVGSVSLYIESFEMGLGYGMPLSSSVDQIGDLNTDNLNSIINFHFGYRYAFYETVTNSLSAFIKVEMLLNEVYSSYPENDPFSTVIDSDYQVELQDQHNPRLAAATIGLAWDFNMEELLKEKPVRKR